MTAERKPPMQSLRVRILRLLEPEGGGPRKVTVLEGIAGSAERLAPVLDKLVRDKLVELVEGNRGGVRYRLTRKRAAGAVEWLEVLVVMGLAFLVCFLLPELVQWAALYFCSDLCR